MRFSYFRIYFCFYFRIILQIISHFFASLSYFFVIIVHKSSALCKYTVLNAQIDKAAFLRNSLAVNNIEFGNPERGGDLIFNYFTFGSVTDYVAVVFKRIRLVAALTPKAEIEGDMGDTHVGLLARLMSQALRKLTAITNRSKTCVIFINQLREKVGVMFGNPETTPGGKALKYFATVRLDIRKADKPTCVSPISPSISALGVSAATESTTITSTALDLTKSSGKTTVALHIIAETQKAGGVAAFIDAEHALDAQYAHALGVDTDELYLSQPDTGEQALDICESLVRSSAVDVIVVDSVAALTPKA